MTDHISTGDQIEAMRELRDLRAEVERLREQSNRRVALLEIAHTEAVERGAEVERLREALRGERGHELLDRRDDETERRLLERLERDGLLTTSAVEARGALDA